MPRKRLATIVTLVAALFVGLAVVEFGLRLFLLGSLRLHDAATRTALIAAHPKLGWVLKPDLALTIQTLDYIAPMRTNSRGLRDRERDYAKPEGVFRILILGDSFMQASQVPYEASLPALLEEALGHGGVEVINMGVQAYGTAQELIYMQEEGLKYAPDLALLAFYAQNDIRNNARALEELLWGPEAFSCWARPYASCRAASPDLAFAFPNHQRVVEYIAAEEAKRAQDAANRSPWARLCTPYVMKHLLAAHTTRRERPPYDPHVVYGVFQELEEQPSALSEALHSLPLLPLLLPLEACNSENS